MQDEIGLVVQSHEHCPLIAISGLTFSVGGDLSYLFWRGYWAY